MSKNSKQKKFIFVTGGVLSSIGKGIASASIGFLIEKRGVNVTLIKMDPYINVDPGTMSPFQHGEVFVLDDGSECDLDLGHYERFVNCTLTKQNNFTTGKVYDTVIQKERRGDYLGKTVQVIPHITDQIKQNILEASQNADLTIVEVGGTVGDIESLPFLEAIRQFKVDAGSENVLYLHVTLVPYVGAAGELKTKPTQHSVKELREIGIQPDVLLCRCDRSLPKEAKEKIALFCNVESQAVFSAKDVRFIYEVPLNFHAEGLDEYILERLKMWTPRPDLRQWEELVDKVLHLERKVKVGIVGKYVDLTESYKSLSEALLHAGIANNTKIELVYIDSEEVQKGKANDALKKVDAILIPGGFGERGIEGKILAIEYARVHQKPFFGICLGMQLAVIEYARNVCGIHDATSEEFNPQQKNALISAMEDQKNATLKLGGTMRLGAYPCHLKRGSRAFDIYQSDVVSERHRHRYEVNPEYKETLESKGLTVSGVFRPNNGELVEMVEISRHPWFLACQFHPEFKSRPLQPHPLFVSYIGAALKYAESKVKESK